MGKSKEIECVKDIEIAEVKEVHPAFVSPPKFSEISGYSAQSIREKAKRGEIPFNWEGKDMKIDVEGALAALRAEASNNAEEMKGNSTKKIDVGRVNSFEELKAKLKAI